MSAPAVTPAPVRYGSLFEDGIHEDGIHEDDREAVREWVERLEAKRAPTPVVCPQCQGPGVWRDVPCPDCLSG
jgi:hypothetical protein